jgi:hypothetical protein
LLCTQNVCYTRAMPAPQRRPLDAATSKPSRASLLSEALPSALAPPPASVWRSSSTACTIIRLAWERQRTEFC